jgi:hypothetical protein
MSIAAAPFSIQTLGGTRYAYFDREADAVAYRDRHGRGAMAVVPMGGKRVGQMITTWRVATTQVTWS